MAIEAFCDKKNRLVFKLPKLIDLKNGSEIKASINKQIDTNANEYTEYVLDLSNLEFIDSLGLGIFVGIQRKISDFNKRLYFSNPTESIKRIFEVTQLQRVFNIIEE